MIQIPVLVLAAALAGAASARPADVPDPAQQPPRPAAQFAAEASVVVVDAVVLDKAGNPVRDLTADDFVVKEDGAVQAVTSFRAVAVAETAEDVAAAEPGAVSSNTEARAEVGRTFAVVFDATHLTPETTPRAKAAVRRFLAQGVRGGDAVALVSTGSGAWWTACRAKGSTRCRPGSRSATTRQSASSRTTTRWSRAPCTRGCSSRVRRSTRTR